MYGVHNDPDPAKLLYGDPQHETRAVTDPERARVVVAAVPPERVLYTYLDLAADADAWAAPTPLSAPSTPLIVSRP